MTLLFDNLGRLSMLFAVGLTAIAVGLGRAELVQPGIRTPRHVRHVAINGYALGDFQGGVRSLDTETGRWSRMAQVEHEEIDQVSCSPWEDRRGGSQLVGRWINRPVGVANAARHGYGIARYALPGGKLLGRVATAILPVAPPCWFPGTKARILFVAGDGSLYHYAFEPDDGPGRAEGAGADPQPKAVTWSASPPGRGPALIRDVSWPAGPQLGGRVLVSLHVDEGRSPLANSKLWWLQLSPDGTAIEAAGPLTVPTGPEPEVAERCPRLATTPDGDSVLAYLSQSPGQAGFQLRVGRLQIDPDTRTPTVRTEACRVLASGCVPAAPAFSADGRSVSCVLRRGSSPPEIRRIALDDVFGREARPVASARSDHGRLAPAE